MASDVSATKHERRGLRTACRLVGILVAGIALPAEAQQRPPAPVKVALVKQADPAVTQTFVGTVLPVRSSTVGSTVESRVVELTVEEGDAVAGGDVLARLRTEQLDIELAAAEAELKLQQRTRDELAISVPESIRQAEARVKAAAALVKFAQLQLKHAQALFQRKAASADDVEEKASAAVAAEQKHLENQSALKLAKDSAPAKLAQAEARVQSQQEQILRLKDQIAEHTIRAPFDGFVAKKHTEVGQWVAKGGPVADVVEIDLVDIEVSVPEKVIPRIRVGSEARITIESLGDSSGALPPAKVTAIIPQADVRSRSFPVRVRLNNQSEEGRILLMPGMFARVHLVLDSSESRSKIWVPKNAVVFGQDPPTVFVVVEGKAVSVPVQVLRYVGDRAEVRGDLQPGQQVVVEGNERIKVSGTPVGIVNAEKSAPSPSPKKPSE